MVNRKDTIIRYNHCIQITKQLGGDQHTIITNEFSYDYAKTVYILSLGQQNVFIYKIINIENLIKLHLNICINSTYREKCMLLYGIYLPLEQ